MRRWLVLGLLLAVGVTTVVLASPRLAIAYLQRSIESASTEAEERDALCQANRWVHSGLTPTYSVTCQDGEGHEIRPWIDGAYDSVAHIELRWTTGQTVERRLLHPEPLSCVFGE